ncbi:hypothetical protein MTR67_019238 [Solanum verrucosum]|uniref:Uncharacterized protein n=1 Tax=Solanum verrucosum TaxID=315347 RepID=A0AAF0TUK6_SOLVR|nr:hypothetical protein MTR67_019238 [Solanum verrucosum]
MELLKDYDVIIQYHPSMTNVVADTLSQKKVSMNMQFGLFGDIKAAFD